MVFCAIRGKSPGRPEAGQAPGRRLRRHGKVQEVPPKARRKIDATCRYGFRVAAPSGRVILRPAWPAHVGATAGPGGGCAVRHSGPPLVWPGDAARLQGGLTWQGRVGTAPSGGGSGRLIARASRPGITKVHTVSASTGGGFHLIFVRLSDTGRLNGERSGHR